MSDSRESEGLRKVWIASDGSWYPYQPSDVEAGEMELAAYVPFAALAQQRQEIEALRGLVECAACTKELGDSDYAGWMPGLCPGCQAEVVSAEPSQEVLAKSEAWEVSSQLRAEVEALKRERDARLEAMEAREVSSETESRLGYKIGQISREAIRRLRQLGNSEHVRFAIGHILDLEWQRDRDRADNAVLRARVEALEAEVESGWTHAKHVAEHDALRAQVEALRESLKSEADYCYGWADHYAATNPERAARHRERGDRLSAVLQGERNG